MEWKDALYWLKELGQYHVRSHEDIIHYPPPGVATIKEALALLDQAPTVGVGKARQPNGNTWVEQAIMEAVLAEREALLQTAEEAAQVFTMPPTSPSDEWRRQGARFVVESIRSRTPKPKEQG